MTELYFNQGKRFTKVFLRKKTNDMHRQKYL